MTPTQQLQAFAQSVYLVIKGRYYDGITTSDGTNYVNQVLDWANQYLDELEMELNPSGAPVDWDWVRQSRYTLGTAVLGNASLVAPTNILNLIAEENRYVQILQGSSIISSWAVVDPRQISSLTDRITEDMVALVNGTLVFSRTFRDTESTGTIIGDVTLPIPRLSLTDVTALNTVKPKQLMILGVAKNASLPDIVQGGLSPSYAQKYSDLLASAIARNGVSSRGDFSQRDNLGYISGVGF